MIGASGIRKPTLVGLLAIVTMVGASTSTVTAQRLEADTLGTVAAALHSPRAALWRSAAVPGWGQIYNKQYIKLPFIYGTLGFLIYQAASSHDDYILYREAFQYKAWQELVDSGNVDENPKSGFKSSYDEISATFGPISSRPLGNQRDIFRRARDLSLVGVGLVYGLAMLDAFVSAHLLDFDVGEDLNVRATPTAGGIRLSARFQLGMPE